MKLLIAILFALSINSAWSQGACDPQSLQRSIFLLDRDPQAAQMSDEDQAASRERMYKLRALPLNNRAKCEAVSRAVAEERKWRTQAVNAYRSRFEPCMRALRELRAAQDRQWQASMPTLDENNWRSPRLAKLDKLPVRNTKECEVATREWLAEGEQLGKLLATKKSPSLAACNQDYLDHDLEADQMSDEDQAATRERMYKLRALPLNNRAECEAVSRAVAEERKWRTQAVNAYRSRFEPCKETLKELRAAQDRQWQASMPTLDEYNWRSPRLAKLDRLPVRNTKECEVATREWLAEGEQLGRLLAAKLSPSLAACIQDYRNQETDWSNMMSRARAEKLFGNTFWNKMHEVRRVQEQNTRLEEFARTGGSEQLCRQAVENLKIANRILGENYRRCGLGEIYCRN